MPHKVKISLLDDVDVTGLSDGQLLLWDNASGTWKPHTPAAAGMTNPMTTAADIIVGGTAGAPARLPKGSDGQVLTVNATTHLLDWETPSSGFSDPTTTKGDLIVHGSSTTRMPVGTDGQVVTADSTQSLGVKWATPSAGATGWSFSADTAPGSADAMDDEFADATSQSGPINGLDAKWSKLNAGSDTQSFADGRLTYTHPATSDIIRGIYQSTPAGNWKIRAKVFNPVYADNIYNVWGLMVSKGTSLEHRVFGLSGNIGVSNGTGTGGTGSIANSITRASWAYLEAEWDGTSVYFRVSLDGQHFSLFSTWTPGATPALVGLAVDEYSSTVPRDCVCEWFRRIA